MLITIIIAIIILVRTQETSAPTTPRQVLIHGSELNTAIKREPTSALLHATPMMQQPNYERTCTHTHISPLRRTLQGGMASTEPANRPCPRGPAGARDRSFACSGEPYGRRRLLRDSRRRRAPPEHDGDQDRSESHDAKWMVVGAISRRDGL